MNQAFTPLSNWQNFYVIVGSAAGALTGLQFVVVTLIAQARAASTKTEIRAFGTPTVIHFCIALLVSALTAAPWRSLAHFGASLGIVGLVGAIYSLITFWHARKAAYDPDISDWIWYTILPLAAHLVLVASAVFLCWNSEWPLWMVAADTLNFLLLGVHNSWDTVTYVALNHARKPASTGTNDPNRPNE
jgi:predicted membrane-bound spermidine synthase